MRSTGRQADLTTGWEIARPARTTVPPGIDMAGFSIRGDSVTELRAIPHPAVTVVVEFGGHPLAVSDASGRTHSGSLAVGLAFDGINARAVGLDCVQVRVSPVLAHAVLGVPPAELGGTIVALEDLWARDVARLRERLHYAPTWQERFALVDAALSDRLRNGRTVDPEVAWTWRQLQLSHGRSRVGDLATETGWSRQRLWSRFGAQIGLTPKRAAMLVRFDRAIHRLADGHTPARVAADGGYADQSHLHREVRAFTSTAPTAAAAEPWLAADHTAWPGIA
ncbi:helix-turn-helix domain-containing protein [Nocardia sp. NPDC052566]|uniref:helix-turn-helix domain-containing protein n=1 Tax=Nocardia sp. NPDC052566 TaxID=3364330 RepID=UPI0037C544B6